MNKSAVFIDAANIELSAKSKGWRVDYKKLYDWLKSNYKIGYVGFFTARFETSEHEKFLTFLKKTGYNLVTKPLKHILDKDRHHMRKANFDVEITVGAMKRKNDFEIMVLFSGDSDFNYLIRELKTLGKKVIVVSMKYHVSKELVESSDKYIDITKIKKLVARSPQKSPSFTTGG
ncbi:MAG: hypothetical protein UX80_C0002G0070 [Candidatus Amesbacteria bacterium GW2011_GWA2_47_11b]|uniref:NYN domain-containing protein n=3 Tax=Candidatus Amesiibacteriota TaxID=1752730 RepID=A0A0G1SI63_9BACT|nr:MAG: hypothetical protein UX42_C0015G0003 [Microgenomates group bacterium GW2011_GWC1_46_20]KKU58535.1 MAG: hypothetical protein UX80_C0002G0070 [Candidatus Amesbacteria bacterium GW2011_GWA2_47_11b]KKU69096.1 MAG: hypothetical protein UX92_C0015G0003 [Candidatus Amesbacteria bacterium GW2011_GWA1_47_20]KKU83663.1 MAG: hypothetical protein UY11_C0015G0026 [Candidatus Amesbacteria bacterium GW2011_GWC2_47_8]